MSDWFYNLVWSIGYPAFGTSASPVVLHRERLDRAGACILAPNHLSPYDISCLMASTRRVLDFVSITELFKKPLVAWFFRNMGTFPLDRWHPDSPATRTMLDRLKRGRVLVLFPEGQIRDASNSLLAGGRFKPGVTRLAILAGVPIIPCVILGTRAYSRFASWFPLRQTVYALNFGAPLRAPTGGDRAAAALALEEQLRKAYGELFEELREALNQRGKRLTIDEFSGRVIPKPEIRINDD